ncbi:PKD repeat-containing protein [Methanophagales archaeon]|nr:PKD repeat-containing protein [Methanophagales archaeon]
MKYKEKGDIEKMVFEMCNIRVVIRASVAVLCFSLLFAGIGVASAVDIYVATWGSDRGEGTLEEPWQHPAYAAKVAEAGDTIYLLDGTWDNEHIVFANSGTETNPITLKAYSGTPTLDGVDERGIGIRIKDKSYISLSGFLLKNYGTGVRGEGLLRHISISDFTIEDIAGQGISFNGASLQNSEITDFTIQNTGGIAISHFDHSSSDCHDVIISHFTIKDIATEAINWRNAKRICVQHGEVRNVQEGVHFHLSIDDSVMDNVSVVNAGNHGLWIHDHTQCDYPCHNNIIRNCYVAYTRHNAIDLHSGVYNTLIENCELTGDSSMGNGVFFHDGGSGLTVRNCIIHGASPADGDSFKGINVGPQPGVIVEGCTLYNLKSAIEGSGGDYTIRNNVVYSTSWPDTIKLGSNNILCENNDIGGGRYRINNGHGTIRNSLGNRYRVRSENGATVTVEYTDGKTFSVDGAGSYTSYVITSEDHEIEVLGEVSTGTIAGVVTTTTGSPIEGAAVTVDGAGKSDESDSSGVYEITTVPVGTYPVTASASGYEDTSVLAVGVKADEITTINFQLTDEIPNEVITELAGYWKFDEGAGDTTHDSSGNNNDGTIQGASWTEGKEKKGLRFDGTNDYVDCGRDTSLELTGAITVEAWVNWTGDGNPYFVTKCGEAGDRSYDLSGNTNGTVEFRVGGVECKIIKSSGAAQVPIGAWVYLVGTYEPSSYVRLFVNGVLAEEETTSVPEAQGENGLSWYLGSREGDQGWFEGVIDEVVIYNRALSEEEVRAAYEAYAPNMQPFSPYNPSPSDGATDVSIDATLSWTGGDPDDEDTVTYEVYFGTSINPPLVAEDQQGTTYDPGLLNYSTEYYWRINATDNHGASNESEVWSFTTASLSLPGAVSEWHLDEGAGAITKDSSGNKNDATLVNDPTWVKGKVGHGLSFDGTDDYAVCDHKSSLELTGAITVEAWVNWTGDGNPYFVTKCGEAGDRSYDLSGNTDGTVEFRVGGVDCNTIKSSGAAQVPIGEWVYLVGTYEPSNYVRLFVNGTLAEEDTTSVPAAQGENGLSWYIGSRGGDQGWFEGIIDEVVIYNRALSEEEVRGAYEAYAQNMQPFSPYDPSPSDGATGVSIDATLSWTGGDPDDEDTVTYEVYFGTSINPPLVAEDQQGTTYDPGLLNYSTEYYWRINATDNHGASNESEVWCFTTASLPSSELVADWHLDEGSGITAVDSSGNGNDGTLINTPVWVDGKVGKGLSFDGTNDYVDCGLGSSLKITGAITVGAWVNWSGNANPYIVTKTGDSDHRSYDLSGNPGGRVEFRVGGADCNTIKSSGTVLIPTGEWVYLVGTYEPSSYVRLFVNGALAKENTASIPAVQGDNGLPWYIGARGGGQGSFNGVIDEVEIYNRALSEEEIRADYKAYPTNQPPTAIIDSITSETAEQGEDIIVFTGHGTDTDGSIVAYNWRSDVDGQLSTTSSFSKPASELSVGTHTIYFKVQDDEGAWSTEVMVDLTINFEPENLPPVATNTSTTTATIADTEPTAAISATPTSGQEPLTVAFTDVSASYDGIEAWEWDFDNDGETDSTEQNPTHEYAEDGVYTVSLTIYESDGDCGTKTKADYIRVINVNEPPVSDPSGPYTGTEGVAIAYGGSDSYDPDGSIVAYEWEFGDGSTATGVVPTHTYAQNGTYSVSLKVTDDEGATNTSTTTATIADTEPTAAISATPTSGQEPLTVAFTDVSASYDGIEAWEWDFDNDGETDSTEQNPKYVYAEEGVYTVSLTVTESDGDTDTLTKVDYITVTKVNQIE